VVVTSLREAIAKKNNITVLEGEQVQSLIQDEYGIRISTKKSGHIDTQFVVAADGASSTIRGLCGTQTTYHDYEQKGIVCEVSTQLSHEKTAWQCFTATGPIAFLPLSNGNSSIVWSATNSRADELLAMDDEAFNHALAKAFQSKLGEVKVQSQRVAFGLEKQHAKDYVNHNIVLVGDAAHTIHPLAGQGANLGFMDAATLVEELAAKPSPFPSKTALRRYERRRKHANYLVQTAMDGFNYGFLSKDERVAFTRNEGLKLSNRIGMLKRQFAKFAAGLEGDIPVQGRLKR